MKKILELTFILLLIFFIMGTVSAEDISLENTHLSNSNFALDNNVYLNGNNSLSNDALGLNDSDNDIYELNTTHLHTQLSNLDDSPIKASTITAPGGTFSQLASIISSAGSGDTIVLTGDYTRSGYSTSGISFNKNLIFQGNGHTLNGEGSGRIFTISSSPTVKFYDVNFVRGYAASGGAIYLSGSSNLYVYGCNFTNNTAYSSSGGEGGAAIYDRSGATIYSYNCIYRGSWAGRNANIYISPGKGYFYNCHFIENAAGIYSAALEIEAGTTCYVTCCTFVNNTSPFGVAISSWTGSDKLYVSNSAFVNNGGTGTDIKNNGGSTMVLTNNWWGSNNPDWFSLLSGVSMPETWVVMNFTNNTPFSTSGGSVGLTVSLDWVYNHTSRQFQPLSGDMALRNVTYNLSTGSITKSVSEFSGIDSETFSYGAVSSLNISATVDNQVLYLYNPWSFGSFKDLQRLIDATSTGGVLVLDKDYYYDSSRDLPYTHGMYLNKSITIIGNGHTISGVDLARIFNVTSADVTLFGINFTNGYSISTAGDSNYRGGAIFSIGNNLNLTNCTFMNNYAKNYGGAVEQYSGNLIVENCSFINNTAGSSYGAVEARSSANITGSLFKDNVASSYAALYITGANSRVNNNVFINNVGSRTVYRANGNLEYNWWGTNSPSFSSLIYGSYPQTYVIMNFTSLHSFNSTGGSVTLLTTLDTVYNSSSASYSKLTGSLPDRPVSYIATSGSFSSSQGIVENGNNTVNFTYPGGLSYLIINSTVDNQMLFIASSDISVNISVNNDLPQLADVVTYTIVVRNNNGNAAKDVFINFLPPSSFTYVSDLGSGSYNSTSGVWSVGNLNVGASKTLTVSVRVPFNESFVDKKFISVVNSSGSYIDLNPDNNNDTINITVLNRTSGSYTFLQYLIDSTPSGGELNLTFDITYDPVSDAWLQNGMHLNKTITINGNGHFINGTSKARIFIVDGNYDLNLSNIHFTEGYATSGGAIHTSYACNLYIYNCNFTNNTAHYNAGGEGGASLYSKGNANIYCYNSLFANCWSVRNSNVFLTPGRAYFYNCSFMNNRAGVYSAAIEIQSGSFCNVSYCTFINNSAPSGAVTSTWGSSEKFYFSNSVFVNNTGGVTIYNGGGSIVVDNNWWGTNDPNWGSLLSGVSTPETWVVMNFTHDPISYSASSSNLNVSLNTVYNTTSNTFTPLNGLLPYRNLTFTYTHGTVSPNETEIQNSAIANFTYPVLSDIWIVNATIDNQVLSIGSSDLGIYIVPNNNPVDDGKNVSYTIYVVNNGLMNATKINVTLNLPSFGLINISTNTSNGTYNNTTCIWEIGDLGVGEVVTLIVNGTLEDPGPYLIWNATIWNTTGFWDNNFTNNTYISNLTVNQIADLEIHKNISNFYPQTKENVTYIITVFNHGPSTAINVTVFDNLSDHLIYINSSATKGKYNETTGIWLIENMTPYSNETLNITVLVNKSGFTDNFVNVTSNITDNNLTNNYDNLTFETPPLSDIWVTINMEPQSSNYITYHIQAGNNGLEDANGTVVVFNLSNLYIYSNHTNDKGIYNNLTGVWDIGYLEVNETVNLTLIVYLDFPMGTNFSNITTSVNITSWSTDLYPQNNTDNITFEAEIFGNFRLLQYYVDNWPENTTQILPRSFAYDPVQDAKLAGETYDLINGVSLYKNITIINPYGYILGGFDMARIFNISADNVMLDGLRFFDGNSPLGAALNIHANNVQVLRSNFSGNWLFGDYGGAIYTGGKNTLIMDNIFTENSASKLGGAIGAVGAKNLQILNNTFINNSVESDEIFGGAIGLINTTAIINGNVFLDNIATASTGLGSAIYTNNSNVNLEANWFGNNTPDMVTDELIWGNKPETYIILDWEIVNPNMTGVTLNAVFFLYNTTTGNKTPLGYGLPYRKLNVTARNPTVSWYNTTFTGNNTFNYTYNPSIPVYQVNATVDYQTITLEWSTFLSLNKTLLNDTIWFGDDLIYNITLVNYGPHDSYIVTVSDLLPTGLTINNVSVSYGSTSIIGDNVYWSISINAGSILTLIVNTTPTHEGIFINNVTINSTNQYDYILWGNMSARSEVLPLFDLSINFTISNPPYYVGEDVNYTITIHNNGPSNASNVSVYIPIPSGLTFLYAWNLDGYIPNYNNVTGLWNVGTLNANETIQINITLRLKNPGEYNQTVNITGYGVEINETDNNKTISFNVTTQVDLELNMTISTNETLYGNWISITYSLINKGPSPATNVTVFTVFSGLTFSSSSGYGSFNNITPFTGYWYVGNLNNGSLVTRTVYLYAYNIGDFTVTGRANCSDNESYWPDNYDNVTLKVLKYANLSITKTVSNTTPYVGQIINYTITVKNNGGFDTENVTVYDNLSSYLIYDGNNPNFNGTHWFAGNLTVGESKNITFNVTVNESGLIWNNVTVNSSLNDSNYGNNHAEVSINAIYKYADLSITKTVSNSTPFLEQTITYTITVKNNGGFDTENVTVYDLLPGVLIYDNLTPGFNGTEWFVGNLSVGESKNITFNVTVDGIGIIWNNVTVNSSLRDNNPNNNHDEVSISVPVADDLRMYINIIPLTPSSNSAFIINLSVWNRGFTDNQNVTVEFHIPTGLIYLNSTNMGAYSPSTGFWDIGFLGNGVWTNLEIWVYPATIGNITAEANVSGQVTDVAPWNNRANITFEIISSFDLAITKTANTTTIEDGDLIGFDITVWNKGPYMASDVKITDYLPNGLVYYSNNASGIYDNTTRTVNWTIPIMNMGDNLTFHLTLRLWNPGLSFTNIVTAEAYGTDSNITDNTATITINVTQNNDLEVKINASKTKDIDLGETITFYITVINHGPSNATNVITHFTVPSIFTYISDNGGGNYQQSTGEWLIGNLGSGNNITLKVTANLTTMGVCKANTTVNSTYLDKNLTNNYAEINLTATPFFDLNITAYWNLTNNTLVWQNLANLTIIVSNKGPENATNVTVKINVPGTSYVSSNGNFNNTTMQWNIGNLTVGEYKNITITFKGETCGFYWTTGNITGHGHDTNLSNNNYTLNLSIIPVVDLVMTNLTVNATYAGIDEILEFNVTVYNKGPCNATNVTIVGFLPANWTIYSGNLIANIPVNSSHTFNILVNASTYGNFTIGFNATINGIDTYPLNNNKTIGPIEIIYHANIMITIKENNNYPVTGDMIVYVITVSNLDWRTAHNVTANITIPSNLTLDHYYLASGTYNLGNGTWTIGNMSFRNSTTMFLFARVNTQGDTSFWVNVTGADYDFYPENNNDTSLITASPGLDLNITITANNSTPNTGDNVTFTVTVENIGLVDANGVNVDINIPAGFINPTSTDLNFTGNGWFVGNLNSGTTRSFNFTLIPISTNNLTINVSVNSNKFDCNMSNNFDNVTVSPISASDLQINITCNNTTPTIGENVTYTITIYNNGLIGVDNVVVFNNLPFSLAYSTSVPSYNPVSKMWSISNLPAGAKETLNITINHTSSGIFNYNVNITGNTIDTNLTNNLDNITIIVAEDNDLKIEFTVSNNTVLDENLLEFTITVINDGIYNNTNVKVYTNLPNTSLYNSTEVFDTILGIWDVGDLLAGENKTIKLLVNLTNVGNYTYWANATGKLNDRNYSNNNQSLNITVYADYDLQVNITRTNTSIININDTVTFTITVKNYGPSTAYDIQVLNNIPGTLTGISKGTYTANVWNISSLASGEMQTLNLTIKPALNGTYTYNIVVSADNFQYDRNNTNNNDNITINVTNIVDLIINITSNKTLVNKTEIIEFTVTVYNNGTITANNVFVNTENLFVSVLSVISSTGFVSSDSWLILSLAPNTSETLKIIRTINNDTLVKVNVSSDNQEEDNSSNFANTTVYIVKETDLSINITANTSNIYIGDNVTFTVTVFNLGNKTAENVTVHLDLPYSVSYDNVYMYDSQQGIWLIGDLENKTSMGFNVTATINTPGVITYNATVNTTTFDINLLNNYDNVTLNITSILDLELSLALNTTDTIYSTDSFIVFVNVTNYGPSNATGVTVNLNIPGTTYNTNNGTYASGIWNIGNIPTGETVNLNITCNLTSSNNGIYYANVTSNEKDKNTSNNNASINLTILDISDLEVSITSSTNETDLYNSLTYTVTVTNYGPDNVNDAVVKVDLPSSFNVTFNMSSNGVFNGTHWILSTLGTGFSGIANLYITGSYNSYGNQTTFVSVNSSNQDNNNTNNKNNVSVWITPVCDLLVNFTNNPYYNLDGTITFNITVTNLGPCNASFIEIHTNLNPTNDYNESSGYFDTLQNIWYISKLNVGESQTLIINTTALSMIKYYANATSKTQELNNTDNIKYLNFTITPISDLYVNITVNNSNPVYGETVTFTITVGNLGIYNATSVIVYTDLPPSPIYTLSKGLFDTINGNWSVGNLTVGETATLNITINITNLTLFHTNITGNVNDTNLSNNNDTINLTITSLADLNINLTINQTLVTVGDNITITINLTNNGPNIAENITINTTLPIGFTPDSTYNWNLTNLTNNTSIQFNITGILNTSGFKQIIVNISSATRDNNTINNYNSLNFNVEDTVDLIITINSNTTNILAGEYINLIVNVTNLANGTAKNVTVKTNIFNATGDKTGYYDKDTGYWYIGNLNNTQTALLNITIQITENTTFTVNVNTTNLDTNTSNNNDSININTTPLADIEITVNTNTNTLYLEDTITYTITVTNKGYSTAENVTVNTNLTSTGFNFTYSNDTQFNNTTGTWTIGNLTKNQTTILIIKYIVNTTGNITTNFNTNTTTLETNTTNNQAQNTIEILNNTKPLTNFVDLIINITVDNPTPNINTTITFNIKVFNNASTTATNVTILNFLPTGITPIGTYTGNWTTPTLLPYNNISYTFQANITQYGSFVSNTTANSDQWDINPTNNKANVLIISNAPSGDYTDLTINITRTGNTTMDQLIKYTINVTNMGSNTANDVNVTISLFTGLNYTSDNGSGTYNFTNSLWNIGNLNSGTSSLLEITLNITKTGYYNNAFLVYSNTMDKNPQNNLILDNFEINDTRTDITVKIIANKTYVTENETIQFTITVTNHLNPVNNVNITLDIPNEFNIINFPGYTNGSYYIGTMLSGEIINFTFTAKLNSTNSSTITINSTLNETDSYLSDNYDTITITPIGGNLNGVADLHINITVNEQYPEIETVPIFNVWVTNNGPDDATNIEVPIYIPADCISTSADMYWDNSTSTFRLANLTLGSTIKFEVSFRISTTDPILFNASAKSDQFDPNITDNKASISLYPWEATPTCDLNITIVPIGDEFHANDTVKFNVTIRNFGEKTAFNVSVRNIIPPGLTLLSISTNWAYTLTSDGWFMPNHTINTNKSFILTYKIDNKGLYQTTMEVNSSTLDVDPTSNGMGVAIYAGEAEPDRRNVTTKTTGTVAVATLNGNANWTFKGTLKMANTTASPTQNFPEQKIYANITSDSGFELIVESIDVTGSNGIANFAVNSAQLMTGAHNYKVTIYYKGEKTSDTYYLPSVATSITRKVTVNP